MAVMSMEEAQAHLDEVAAALPQDIFNALNGGVVLLEELKPSRHGHGLVTMGTYHNEPTGLGRYIAIYYGSFVSAYGSKSPEQQKKALRDVLCHELTHHIESLAGVRDLEVKDEQFIEGYTAKR